MKVIVTGATGRLGSALVPALARRPGIDVLPWDRSDFDLDAPDPVVIGVRGISPDLVVHTAAWTDVDGCARDPDLAMRRNGIATGVLADACAEASAGLIVISTNEVFDGLRTDGAGYRSDDATAPANPYGASKLAGEQASRRAYEAAPTPDSDRLSLGIVRTAWLFGAGKPDFPTKILQAAGQARLAGRPLRVVADETGTPTHVDDLADGIVRLIAAGTWRGVHHIVNAGRVTRAGWARDVLGRAGESVPLEEVRLADFDRPSTPPPWAVLEPTPLPGGPLRVWQAAMADWRPPATIAVRS